MPHYRPKNKEDQEHLQQWYFSTRVTPAATIGYPYPGCTTELLRSLDHAHEIAHNDAENWKPTSSAQAAAEFQAALKKPPSKLQRESIRRLKAVWHDKNCSPDVAMKSFFDLDVAYFGSYLKDRCRLRWKGSTEALQQELRHDPTIIYGFTVPERGIDIPVVRIRLNAEKCLLQTQNPEDSIQRTIGTLLHEMIHGTFIQAHVVYSTEFEIPYNFTRCTGHPHEDHMDKRDSNPGHNWNFHACAVALDQRTVQDIGVGVRWRTKPGNKRGLSPPRQKPTTW